MASKVLVVTLTDFGRTAAENGTGGTDHGWANCMFVAGGAVAKRKDGKKVVAKWPGLGPKELHEGRDLLHTTDFRDCLGDALAKLEILDRAGCTKHDALTAWDDVFNATYFKDQIASASASSLARPAAVASGLAFPNRPVVPNTSPGFA